MKRHIENLRQKPEHVRKQIAFFTSLGVTVIILAFWVASFGAGNSSVTAQAVGATKTLTPAANLKASFFDAVDSIKKTFTGFSDSSYSSESSVIEVE
jgi:hypothetical protein